MDMLTDDFKKSLFLNTGEVIVDYTELGIDSIINDGILKEIPIVKSITTVLKVCKNVHDRNLLKQTLIFINEFNNGTLDEEKKIKYREKLESNEKECQEELGRVILLLNNIDNEKSIMLAKLFKAYINQEINWNEFCEFTEILNRLFVGDVKILKYIKEQKKVKGNEGDNFRLERLYSLGIIGNHFIANFDDLKDNFIEGRVLNSIGNKLCNIIL